MNPLVESVYMGGKPEMRALHLSTTTSLLVEGRCGDYAYGLPYLALITYSDQSYLVVVFHTFTGHVVGLGAAGDGGPYVRSSERSSTQISGV